jgi:hypothetical protein
MDDLMNEPPGEHKPRTSPPEAPCRLVRGRTVWQWETISCPHCGGQHWHGGGYLHEDPRKELGHRRGHCGDPIPNWRRHGSPAYQRWLAETERCARGRDIGYVLTDGDPVATDRFIADTAALGRRPRNLRA